MNEDWLKKKMEQAYDLIEKANDQMMDIWLGYILFSWQWWLGMVLSIAPWILWIKLRNKQMAGCLLLAGFFVIIISSWLDSLGVALGLWHYTWEVIPFIPANLPWNFSLLPVTVMFFLQYKPTISPFIKALAFAGFSAYIAEPLSQWIGLYEPEQWRRMYSFLIYIVIYLMAHYLSTRTRFAKVHRHP